MSQSQAFQISYHMNLLSLMQLRPASIRYLMLPKSPPVPTMTTKLLLVTNHTRYKISNGGQSWLYCRAISRKRCQHESSNIGKLIATLAWKDQQYNSLHATAGKQQFKLSCIWHLSQIWVQKHQSSSLIDQRRPSNTMVRTKCHLSSVLEQLYGTC